MQHEEHTSAVLAQLKAMKMQLMIDDFGTGYSSLSYLHRLPIDVLKIDRSFVSNMELGNKNSEIVRTILSLAANLGMKTVAEGVEKVEQVDALKNLRCHYAQGYFFARPQPAEKIDALLKQNVAWKN
jgi:EAL domain-containing protein (putative c-di-GMP-specific phosphodiesterase class I)